MSDISTTSSATAGSKALWVAVGVLGAAVVGLGGALYYAQTQQPDEAPAAATAVPAPHAEPATKPAPVAKTAKPAPRTAEVPPAPAKIVCADCAIVTAVTPIEREGQASGTGAVAGGVLGAVIGNQIGQGQGKDVATVIGAIGGGIAGNQMEKKMKKVTAYVVELRMDDGSRRTLELAEPASVGARVRVNGNALAPLNGAN